MMTSNHINFSSGSSLDPHASFKIGNSVEGTTQPKACRIFKMDDHRVQTIDIPVNFNSLDDLIVAWNRNAFRKGALQRAREWMAESFLSHEAQTVKSIRLKKGLSQSQLASLAGTSQSHIARIEKGSENVAIETCRKLCSALEVDMNTLNNALQRQEQILANKVLK